MWATVGLKFGSATDDRRSSLVARLLGAENIGYGRAVPPDCIGVGAGVRLAVSGPPLEPFRRIGWSVRPERIRFATDGPFPHEYCTLVTFAMASEASLFNWEIPCLKLQPIRDFDPRTMPATLPLTLRLYNSQSERTL